MKKMKLFSFSSPYYRYINKKFQRLLHTYLKNKEIISFYFWFIKIKVLPLQRFLEKLLKFCTK